MLNLYYGVGEYISVNTRSGKWGTGAIEAISNNPKICFFNPRFAKTRNLLDLKNLRMYDKIIISTGH